MKVIRCHPSPPSEPHGKPDFSLLPLRADSCSEPGHGAAAERQALAGEAVPVPAPLLPPPQRDSRSHAGEAAMQSCRQSATSPAIPTGKPQPRRAGKSQSGRDGHGDTLDSRAWAPGPQAASKRLLWRRERVSPSSFRMSHLSADGRAGRRASLHPAAPPYPESAQVQPSEEQEQRKPMSKGSPRAKDAHQQKQPTSSSYPS